MKWPAFRTRWMKQAVLHRKALSTLFLEGLAKSGEPGDRVNRGQSAVNTISSVPPGRNDTGAGIPVDVSTGYLPWSLRDRASQELEGPGQCAMNTISRVSPGRDRSWEWQSGGFHHRLSSMVPPGPEPGGSGLRSERHHKHGRDARSIQAVFSCCFISPVSRSVVPSSPSWAALGACSRSERMMVS